MNGPAAEVNRTTEYATQEKNARRPVDNLRAESVLQMFAGRLLDDVISVGHLGVAIVNV